MVGGIQEWGEIWQEPAAFILGCNWLCNRLQIAGLRHVPALIGCVLEGGRGQLAFRV